MKKGKNLDNFVIYSRRRDGKKTGRGWLYSTSEGDMLTATLAARLGLTVPGLNVRMRNYGVTNPKVVHGGVSGGNYRPGTENSQKGGNKAWRALSDEPRGSTNLDLDC